MTPSRSPLEQFLDLFLYAPVGLVLTARDQLPGLVERGRAELTGQVNTARTVGQFAVVQGEREVRRRLQGTDRPARTGATEAPVSPVSDAPMYPPGPSAAPSVLADASPGSLGPLAEAEEITPAASAGANGTGAPATAEAAPPGDAPVEAATAEVATDQAGPAEADDLGDALAATLSAPWAAGTAVVGEDDEGTAFLDDAEKVPGTAAAGVAPPEGTGAQGAPEAGAAPSEDTAVLVDAVTEAAAVGEGTPVDAVDHPVAPGGVEAAAVDDNVVLADAGAPVAPGVLTDDVLDNPPGADLDGVPGAPTVLADDDALPIPDYDSLSASQVAARLPGLAPDELETVRAYEAAGRARKTVLNRIAALQAAKQD